MFQLELAGLQLELEVAIFMVKLIRIRIDKEPVRFSRWIKEAVYISARKANTLLIGTRAAINSVTPTTAFLTRHRSVVSRTGRTEYQLLLMKASD